MLLVRQQHVQARSGLIALARAFLRGAGYRVKSGEAESFGKRVLALKPDQETQALLEPLLETLALLGKQLATIEAQLERATRGDANVQRLQTMTSIGLITAAALVATFDGAARFHTVQQARSYLGLVPREQSSGEKQLRGHITKTGNRRTRALLVQAAWGILRSKRPEVAHLRKWASALALRRGKRIAVVALARRLAGIYGDAPRRTRLLAAGPTQGQLTTHSFVSLQRQAVSPCEVSNLDGSAVSVHGGNDRRV